MKPNLTHLYTQPTTGLALFFALTTAALVVLVYAGLRKANPKAASRSIVGILCWLLFLGVLAGQGFFLTTTTTPPRFMLAVLPPVLLGLGALATPGGRHFYDGLSLSWLTGLNAVRIPVELALYGLYLQGQVPELMTFEGRNPDILTGLSAVILTYLLRRGRVSSRWLVLWHLLGLAFLFNIVVNAILAAPVPFQQWAFDQPNVGVLKFPFVWLPGFIVPLALLTHIVALRRLIPRTTAVILKQNNK